MSDLTTYNAWRPSPRPWCWWCSFIVEWDSLSPLFPNSLIWTGKRIKQKCGWLSHAHQSKSAQCRSMSDSTTNNAWRPSPHPWCWWFLFIVEWDSLSPLFPNSSIWTGKIHNSWMTDWTKNVDDSPIHTKANQRSVNQCQTQQQTMPGAPPPVRDADGVCLLPTETLSRKDPRVGWRIKQKCRRLSHAQRSKSAQRRSMSESTTNNVSRAPPPSFLICWRVWVVAKWDSPRCFFGPPILKGTSSMVHHIVEGDCIISWSTYVVELLIWLGLFLKTLETFSQSSSDSDV